MVTFLHTADWQLGMTRHFLDAEAQARFTQDRIDAIVRMAHVAAEHACAFVVVAGDAFDTNQPTRQTIDRALEALEAFSCPVYLLPGNHDHYSPASVYRSASFVDRVPGHVEVLGDSEPRHPHVGVEVVGAPWLSRRPLTDLVTETCQRLVADGNRRVVVGHGGIGAITGDHGEPATIVIGELESAIADGRVSYVALGDRHSTRSASDTGRIWYSGAPEPTSYREDDPGNVLVVELDDGLVDSTPKVTPIAVGRWTFVTIERTVTATDDIDALLADLDAIGNKAHTIVKLKLTGTLALAAHAQLEDGLEVRRGAFGAMEMPDRHQEIHVSPSDDDIANLPVSGYAAIARDRLAEQSRGSGEDAQLATDALVLLSRMAHQDAT